MQGYTENMELLNALKPNRWKVIVSLLPFVFPLMQVVAELQIDYEIIPVELDFVSSVIFLFLLLEAYIAQPLSFIFTPISGFWSHGSLGPFPEGPLLPGSFAVAVLYSMLIYIVWSLVSARTSK